MRSRRLETALVLLAVAMTGCGGQEQDAEVAPPPTADGSSGSAAPPAETNPPGGPSDLPSPLPPSGPALRPGELLVLASGDQDQAVRKAVEELGGSVISVVEETQTYTTSFPVASLEALLGVQEALRQQGFEVVLNASGPATS